ncbi:hypothetical protein CC78DRAFT_26282 [Lojkania enalia]|uniref:Transglycosylase SLT domain-containing protein n=1 Tax=Lojkania enalia TaxID=147567 RepID=A0A9P4K2U2_9PLEO|nr:hypothetical protein CC78DRAFT_26282 [Didymosphaeria enalia]
MHSTLFFLSLLPFSLAVPTWSTDPQCQTVQVTYGDKSVTLDQRFQKDWYTAVDSTTATTQTPAGSDQYNCQYKAKSSFPKMSQWLSFDQMWEINANLIPEHQDAIKKAIVDISSKSKVDARLILALIMQESEGQWNIHCTGEGESDCGLMQMRGSQDVASMQGNVEDTIKASIQDGLYGIKPGNSVVPKGNPGYITYLNAQLRDFCDKAEDIPFAQGNPFAAAFMYNQGHIKNDDLTVNEFGTKVEYATDIANRLMGWVNTGAGRAC